MTSTDILSRSGRLAPSRSYATPERMRWLMHVDILPEDVTALERVQLPAERTPALVYIAGMARSSRRVMHNGLAIAVAVLTVGADGWAPEVFPWWALRFAHTHALRAILREEYSASTGN